ncbi:MAG: hypothetical protein ACI4NN_07195 [Pyramidobacter sp.]
MDYSLRTFLKSGIVEFLTNAYDNFKQECQTDAEKKETELNAYFSSEKSCQALLSEYSLEELQHDAAQAGIDYAGLSKRELAKALFETVLK